MSDTSIAYTRTARAVELIMAEYKHALAHTPTTLLTVDGHPWPVNSTVNLPMTGLPDSLSDTGLELIKRVTDEMNHWFPVLSVELNSDSICVLADVTHPNAPTELAASSSNLWV